ncbi:NUDIX domain-containing protein [Streptomyces sp. DSM 44915]|uniref:NUDIX domain-containing protein n=1 Tax=Streptomyces chisholmiae TaxID=3075540 RepID=A0ABU2JJI4_9ACTN|nr:NUDIX domain-containing protein [Streptomyces sp. DSM 44915]MDT0265151.1 NUDIX domain-containing protein [Streptomyces sp. DSM 44915]
MGRRSARVLLVDARERVLLLRLAGTAGQEPLWMTPGGGVRRFESLAAAAARELWEETGLRVPAKALGAPVAWTGGHADLGWRSGYFEDHFFYHRVEAHAVDPRHREAHESQAIAEDRWWSPAELAAAAEPVAPLGLAGLLPELLAGHRPATPVRLPWHH